MSHHGFLVCREAPDTHLEFLVNFLLLSCTAKVLYKSPWDIFPQDSLNFGMPVFQCIDCFSDWFKLCCMIAFKNHTIFLTKK